MEQEDLYYKEFEIPATSAQVSSSYSPGFKGLETFEPNFPAGDYDVLPSPTSGAAQFIPSPLSSNTSTVPSPVSQFSVLSTPPSVHGSEHNTPPHLISPKPGQYRMIWTERGPINEWQTPSIGAVEKYDLAGYEQLDHRFATPTAAQASHVQMPLMSDRSPSAWQHESQIGQTIDPTTLLPQNQDSPPVYTHGLDEHVNSYPTHDPHLVRLIPTPGKDGISSPPSRSKIASTDSNNRARKKRKSLSTEPPVIDDTRRPHQNSDSPTSFDDGDNKDKRERFLERNRAAAAKCREKKKKEHRKLQEDVEELAAKKRLLTMEIQKLKAEKTALKDEILQHHDCGYGPIEHFLQEEAYRVTSGTKDLSAYSLSLEGQKHDSQFSQWEGTTL